MRHILQSLREHRRSRMLIALFLPFAALLMQMALWFLLKPLTWILFYPAIFLAAWFGSFRIGLVATFISAVLGWFFFIPPGLSFAKASPGIFLSTIIFITFGTLLSVLRERINKAELALREKNESLERALKERRIFAALIENSSDFIGIADETGRPIYVNPAGRRMVGLAPDRPIEKTAIPEYYPPDQRDFASNVIVKAMTEKGHWQGETYFRHWQTEKAIPVSDTHFMICESGTGRVLGMGTVTRDISDIRQARDEIEEVNRKLTQANEEISRLYEQAKRLDELKTQFFANVSHELRTPLTLILGPVDSLLSKSPSGEVKPALEMIARNARSLLKQVNDLLDISKLEAGKLKVTYSESDLAKMLRQVASNFASVAQERRCRFVVEAPGAIPAQIDIEKIERVILNLISNAFKFVPDEGIVRCSLRFERETHRAVLEVADNGSGIPEKYRRAIFERFFQIEQGGVRRIGGTGLGLAIVKDFVELHGGKVGIGKAPEGGALFTIEVPTRAPIGTRIETVAEEKMLPFPLRMAEPIPSYKKHRWEQVAPGKPSHAVGPPILMRKALVLVVEDTPDMLDYLCEALDMDFQIETAISGREGLEKARALHPDLIVSDVMMPEMSGDEMFRKIRATRELESTPVILLTAKADEGLKLELLREGAQDYLIKPFLPDELKAKVKNLLAVRAAEAKYRGLLESAQDAIVVVGADGRIQFANQQTTSYFGYSREELMGKTVEILVPDQVRGAHAAHREQFMKNPKPKQMGERMADLKGKRKDDSEFPVSIALSPLQTPEGVLITAIVRDITEMKKLSEQALRAREETIATVSHDLKNPLTSIQTSLQLLLSKRLTPAQGWPIVERTVTNISHATKQMTSLIEDLLDFSKVESHRLKIEKTNEDVSSLVGEVFEVLEPIAKEGGIELQHRIETSVATAACERKRIIRVLSNLLGNAIKFTPRGGLVTVVVEPKDGGILFSVKDTGPGIGPDQLAHVFERYWQAEETAKKGSGLGLAIARGFVEVHGGKIWVESQSGVGSTFFFTLLSRTEIAKAG